VGIYYPHKKSLLAIKKPLLYYVYTFAGVEERPSSAPCHGANRRFESGRPRTRRPSTKKPYKAFLFYGFCAPIRASEPLFCFPIIYCRSAIFPSAIIKNMLNNLYRFENKLIVALRVSLGLVFFWFGALKVFDLTPVAEVVNLVSPLLASGMGLIILGAVEVLIGIGLMFNWFPKTSQIALVLHLLGTFLVFITAPGMMFDPYFPVLTLAGEFVFKNIILVFAGLVILCRRHEKSSA